MTGAWWVVVRFVWLCVCVSSRMFIIWMISVLPFQLILLALYQWSSMCNLQPLTFNHTWKIEVVVLDVPWFVYIFFFRVSLINSVCFVLYYTSFHLLPFLSTPTFSSRIAQPEIIGSQPAPPPQELLCQVPTSRPRHCFSSRWYHDDCLFHAYAHSKHPVIPPSVTNQYKR